MDNNLKRALKDLLLSDKELLKAIHAQDSEEDEDSSSKKRKSLASPSPLRLKKVTVSKGLRDLNKPSCSKDSLIGVEDDSTRSPDETRSLPESNDGARNSSSPQSDEEKDEMDILEQLLSGEQEEFEEPENDGSESDGSDLEVIGGPTPSSWKVRDKIFKWFKSVADIELKPEDIKSLKDKYKVGDTLQTDFEPPKLPNSIWTTMNSNSKADTYRLRSLHKSQESLYLALIPLLSALDSSPKELREHLTAAIQLVCHSNLSLNRYRRSTVIPYIKKELRKQILNLPVSHNALFGTDFEKSTESVLKEQSALNKVLIQRKPVQQRLGNANPKWQYENTNYNQKGNNFRGGKNRGKGGYRNPDRGSAKRAYKDSSARSTESGGATGASTSSSA